MIIPDTHDLTKKYLSDFNIPLVPAPSNSPSVYNIKGKRSIGTRDDPDSPSSLQKKYFTPFIEKVTASLSTNAWPPGDLEAFDKINLYEFLIDQKIPEEEIARLRMEYIDEWGDGIGSYSALSGFYDLARGRTNLLFRIAGGSDRFPAAFADRLPVVLLNRPVHSITQTDQHVEIAFSENGTLQTQRSDFVVCTIPFSILDKTEMDLSSEKWNVIHELGYTSVSRVYAQVRNRFWSEEGLSGCGYTDHEFLSVFHSTANQPGPAGILEAYLSGKLSQKISAMNEVDRIETTLRWMEGLHPQLKNHIVNTTSICWDNDPLAGGAYSWFKPGQMTNLLPRLGLPDRRIHFAGDHTSALPGWMQGALESAHRAVAEISQKI